MGSIGSILADARRQQNKSLKEVERATRIRARYLEALENDDFASLPGHTYARAFVREYASFLGIDAQPLIAAFNDRSQPSRAEQQIGSAVVQPISRRHRRAMVQPKRPLWMLIGVAGAVLVLVVLGTRLFFAGETPEQRTQVVSVDERAGAVPAPSGSKVSEPAAPAAKPAATGKVTLKANILGPGCWVRVVADGKVLFEGVAPQNSKHTWAASNKLVLRAGDASQLEVSVNGGEFKIFGDAGMVLEETYDPDSK